MSLEIKTKELNKHVRREYVQGRDALSHDWGGEKNSNAEKTGKNPYARRGF